MRITEISVKKYQFTVVVFLFLIASGIYSFLTIPKAEDPEFPISIFPVIAIYPGASPSDVEQLVADRIEKSLNELTDIDRIKTEIKDGVAVIVVEFPPESDPDEKYDEISRQIASVRSQLPQDLYSIEILKIQAGNTNIIQSALVSDIENGYGELRDYAGRLEDLVSGVAGVKKAEIMALPAREMRISIDLPRMAKLGITVGRIISAIQSENANIPGGSVEAGPRKFNIVTGGSYRDPEEVRNTIVGVSDGQVVFLKDVADVGWRDEDPVYFGRYNGKKAVFLVASMKEKQVIGDVRDAIYSVYDDFEKTLPSYLRLERGFDQASNVRRKLGRLEKDFLFAFLLVLITLMPLGIRASGIVMVSIPLSVLIGITGLHLAGFSINQLSIVGAVISLGLLVDDSIVVVENITRWIREGSRPFDAAIRATGQIGPAVLGCTATLILAFLPLMFLPGMAGRYMRSLPTSVTFIVLGSLFVALTIIPFLSGSFLKKESHPGGNIILRGLKHLIDLTYGRALKWTLSHPLVTVFIASVMFLSSLFLVKVIGFSLFPRAGIPQFLIKVETPRGSNIGETDRALKFVEGILSEKEGVNYYMSNTGKGNPMIFYNSFQTSAQASFGEIMCEIDESMLPDMVSFLDELRDTLSTCSFARIYVKEFENGMPVDAPVAFRITGDNLDTLRKWSVIMEEVMRKTEGTIYVKNPLSQPLTDLKIDINSEKASMLGIPVAEAERTIRLAIAGAEAGRFRDASGEDYPIRISLPESDQDDFLKLERIYVSSLNGSQVPLTQVADISFTDSPTLIQHYNNTRSVTVSSSVRTGYNTDRIAKQIIAETKKLDLPRGMDIIAAGEIESRRESFSGVGTAILIAVFGIFAVLVLEFGTFRSTLIVLSVIPLGVIGGLLMLWLTGYDLSFAAAIGFVALTGIEIKNSILLVDFTNHLRREGTGLNEAIMRAGEVRFLPVILTTLTAVGGLLPIALSRSELYSPLAFVIIGGLITSTLFARLVTPVLYKLIPPEI